MKIDITNFYPHNITDTCAVWNVLSSSLLYTVSGNAGCFFYITQYVEYECLRKERKTNTSHDNELKKRLIKAQSKDDFIVHSLDISDLQDISILERRMNLSKGELSSIAFARKTNQAFLTDDQAARELASNILHKSKVQTTPHLFGWLFLNNKFSDSDKDKIIEQNRQMNRPLEKYFQEVYDYALQIRLMQ